MRVLVTGGAGFVARYLTAELSAAGYEVWLSDCVEADLPNYRKVDLTDDAAVRELVASLRPEAVVHLGAISFVPDAAKDKNLLERVNVGGTRSLLDAMTAIGLPRRSHGLPRFLFVSTAQVYLKNPSEYALSKMSAEALVLHSCREEIDCVVARPANHTGPGQSEKFVVPSFIRQALDIKEGRRGCFSVGNLDSVRDFTDVRDVVRAYRLLLEKGESSAFYQIGSPERLTMRELLVKVADTVGVPQDYTIDESLWRPTDSSPFLDTTMISELGWRARISLDDMINDMVRVTRKLP